MDRRSLLSLAGVTSLFWAPSAQAQTYQGGGAGCSARFFPSVRAASSAGLPAGTAVYLEGFEVAGDGGGFNGVVEGHHNPALPGGGSIRPVEDELTPRMFGARGDGSSDDGPAFQRLSNYLLSRGGGDICVKAGNYRIASPVTTPEPVNWVFRSGVVLVAAPTLIRGVVASEVFHRLLFVVPRVGNSASQAMIAQTQSSGTRRTSGVDAARSLLQIRKERVDQINRTSEMSPVWFAAADAGATQDMGEKINLAFQVGGRDTTVRCPAGKESAKSGTIPLLTTIDMSVWRWGQGLVLKGSGGMMASHLSAPTGAAMLLVDMSQANEAQLVDMHLTEDAGGPRSCVGVAIGKTSNKILNSWISNFLVSIYANKGAEAICEGLFVEFSDYGYMISAGDDLRNRVRGMPVPARGVNHMTINGGIIHRCRQAGIHVSGRNAGQSVRALTISNLTVKQHQRSGIVIAADRSDALAGIAFTGCRILKGRGKGNAGAALLTDNADGVTFTNCTFDQNKGDLVKATGNGTLRLHSCWFQGPGARQHIRSSPGTVIDTMGSTGL